MVVDYEGQQFSCKFIHLILIRSSSDICLRLLWRLHIHRRTIRNVLIACYAQMNTPLKMPT